MHLENRLALGIVGIQVISLKKGAEITAKVRKAGYGTIELPAVGQSGPLSLIGIGVPRKQ